MKFTKVGFAYINLDQVTGFYYVRNRDVDEEIVYDIMADNIRIDEEYSALAARKRLEEIVDELNADANLK